MLEKIDVWLQNTSQKNIILLLCCVSLLTFVPFLSSVHLFDWDEINFAECAREMIVTGDYFRVQIDFSPFWEKPPLFIWAQVLCMKVFGINEFAARLPNALIGTISICYVFVLGSKLYNQKAGILWAMFMYGSILPNFYAHSGIIDPLFNLMIFLSLVYIWKHSQTDKNLSRYIVISGLALGAATMTKGPVAILLVVLSWSLVRIYQLWQSRNNTNIRLVIKLISESATITLITAVVCSLWFGADILINGPWFITEFFRYQIRLLTTGDAGHSGPFYYHAVILLLGCFPASFFALSLLYNQSKKIASLLPSTSQPLNLKEQTIPNSGIALHTPAFKTLMVVVFFVVLILFSIVKTKIVHYSSLAYFSITFLAMTRLIERSNIPLSHFFRIIVLTLGSLLATVIMIFPYVLWKINDYMPYIKNNFTRSLLSTPVFWSGYEWVIGSILFFSVIVWYRLLPKNYSLVPTIVLCGGIVCMLTLFLPFIAPKIERITQGTPIEFYQSMVNNDVYIQPINFKSYAHLFYQQKQPSYSHAAKNMNSSEFQNWLLDGAIDKHAYYICKAPSKQNILEDRPHLQLHSEKNGWVILYRNDIGVSHIK